MDISRFFIDRPIFAGVLSVLIFLAGLHRAARAADLGVSRSRAAVGGRARAVSRRQPEGHRRDRRRAARAGDQRRRGHALHVTQATTDGVMTLTVTFKLGTDLDKAQVQVQNRVAQALPRLPEEVRRLGVTTRQELARPDDGRAPRFARTAATTDRTCATTRMLNVKDLLARIAGRRPGAAVRRRRLRDARLARPAEGRRARPHGRRRRRRDPRAERAGRRRRRRRAAGAAGPRLPARRSTRRAGSQSEEEFGDIIVKTGAERRGHAPARHRAHRARRRRLRAALAARQQARGGDPASSRRRARTRSRSPTTCARRWRS